MDKDKIINALKEENNKLKNLLKCKEAHGKEAHGQKTTNKDMTCFEYIWTSYSKKNEINNLL